MAGVPSTGIIVMRAVVPHGIFIPPVSPEEFQVVRGRAYHEVDVLAFQQVGRIGNMQLDSLAWDGFFPPHYDESYCNYPDVDTPTAYVSQLNFAMEAGAKWVVSISGTPFYKTMVLTDFSYSMRAGTEVGEVPYSLSLKEYVSTSAAVVGYVPRPARPPGPSAASPGGVYTIVSGDTLWGIAKRYYGQGSLWPIIWDANRPMRSGNPNLIFPGETITIPPR